MATEWDCAFALASVGLEHGQLTSFKRPNSTSVERVLSWASSRMITLYLSSMGSVIASRSSIPSVMYLGCGWANQRRANHGKLEMVYIMSTSDSYHVSLCI